MDNNTLLLELERINKIENELDRLEALVAFNKTYKKSIFYKKTKLPLLKLNISVVLPPISLAIFSSCFLLFFFTFFIAVSLSTFNIL